VLYSATQSWTALPRVGQAIKVGQAMCTHLQILPKVFGDNGEEELQMAANSVDQRQQSPNIDIVQYTADIDNSVQYDDYDWDKIFAQYGF